MVPFVFTVLLFLAHGSFAHICDICDCQPNRNGVVLITCDGQGTKDLHLTSSMMMGVESTARVIIRNCQIVSVERNSFSQLHNLNTLGIFDCTRLYLATGAFSSLNSLMINNVQDISFGEMALMGARDVKNIIIDNSNITELSAFSLYDVRGMDKFSMNNVNIGRITQHSVNVTAKRIEIQNTKINYVEPSGFVLKADIVFIRKSDVLLVEPNAMSIETHFQTRLIGNNFGGFFQVNITSPFAEFLENRFENLNASVLATIRTPRLQNNFIFGTDYDLFQGFDQGEFQNNAFVCRCGMNLRNNTMNTQNDEILKKNYCMTNCSLSLFEFELESSAGCTSNHDIDASSFCNYGRTFKSDPRITNPITRNDGKNVTQGVIQPRFLDIDGDESSGSITLIVHNFGTILMCVISFLLIHH